MNLNKIVKIIKHSEELGILSKMPSFLIKIWIMYHLYWNKDFILITDDREKGFILFNTINYEIVVIAVHKNYRRQGIGSDLLYDFNDVFVVHNNTKQLTKFYKKNGFVDMGKINRKQKIAFKGGKR